MALLYGRAAMVCAPASVFWSR